MLRKKAIIILLVMLCIIMVSCDESDVTTPTATVKVEVTPTLEPTDAPTTAPTKEPLPSEELGLPSDKADVVFTTDFSKDEIDDVLLTKDNSYSIKDGKLYLSSTDGGETWGGWTTLTPDIACYPKDVYQWEFHIDFQATYPKETEDAPWMAAIIGARVCNYQSAIADTDDGIWVGFTYRNNIVVYPSGSKANGYWPAGAVTIEIPEGFNEQRKLVIVDTGSSLFYYMTTSSNERVLILKIDITEENITVFDGQGNEKKKTENYLDMGEGNHFKIFNHMAACVIDNMAIKSY